MREAGRDYDCEEKKCSLCPSLPSLLKATVDTLLKMKGLQRLSVIARKYLTPNTPLIKLFRGFPLMKSLTFHMMHDEMKLDKAVAGLVRVSEDLISVTLLVHHVKGPGLQVASLTCSTLKGFIVMSPISAAFFTITTNKRLGSCPRTTLSRPGSARQLIAQIASFRLIGYSAGDRSRSARCALA